MTDELERGELERGELEDSKCPLTKRQLEVLRKAEETDRLTDEELAAALFVSPKTIKKHMENICKRVGEHSRFRALRHAQHQGWLHLPPG